MNWIAELLPLCFVRWYTRKFIERFNACDRTMASPREGVWIECRDPQNPLSEVEQLVRHCWVHSGHVDCGFNSMTTEQRELYARIIGRTNVGV